MEKLIIVSNRLPVSLSQRNGNIHSKSSSGGLATGLKSLHEERDIFWIGWPGNYIQNNQKTAVASHLRKDHMKPVFLTADQMKKFYEGFSNDTIWPLFHYFPQNTVYNETLWNAYKTVNKLFFNAVLEEYREGDTIWIHDYQLFLLPGLLRNELPKAKVGFFLHIPFPSFELFRLLPWRTEILKGLLGADLIGFHTFDYARHFLSSSMRLLGVEHHLGQINYDDREIRVDSFPMGIDYKKYAEADKSAPVKKEIEKFSKMTEERKIILSIDRLDYAKGILQRLQAFQQYLHENPSIKGNVSLILLVVPSRSKVPSYKELKHELDEMVGNINGEHGTMGWTPVWYFYKSFPFNSLAALYNIADVCLITSFRDGMNLVSKEYIASKKGKNGVLILSELAGAASELSDASIVNPNNLDEIVEAIGQALNMSMSEQKQRMESMYETVKRYNVNRWAKDFLDRLDQIKDSQKEMDVHRLNQTMKEKLLNAYCKSEKKLLLLDYDGTLVGFAPHPDKAAPDDEIIELLEKLSDAQGTEIVIISGRDKKTLSKWITNKKINIVAEHGAWIKEKAGTWRTIEPLSQNWKQEFAQILELYVDRTPGSFIEEKDFSLAWHYRKADVGLGQIRAWELIETLRYFTQNLNLQVLEGSKVVEIKNSGINKGRAALHFCNGKQWDFILAAGDDWTDEDMFKELPVDSYTIKVGIKKSAATYNVKSYMEIRELLRDLAGKE